MSIQPTLNGSGQYQFIYLINFGFESFTVFLLLVILEAAQAFDPFLLLELNAFISPLDILPSKFLIQYLQQLFFDWALAIFKVLVIRLFRESQSCKAKSIRVIMV